MSIESERSRLYQYHPSFDTAVLDQVAAVADRQNSLSWERIQSSLPDTKLFTPGDGKPPIEVIDIKPKHGYESTHVFHLPMGGGLDASMRFVLAMLAAAEPTKRLIAAGNPGAPGQASGTLRTRDIPAVWNGDMRPTIDPLMRYLAQEHIAEALHTGGSCGADRAAAAAGHAEKYDHYVPHGIFIEPASVTPRSLLDLGLRFLSCAPPLAEYVHATSSQPYLEARRQGNRTELEALGAMALGIVLRPSNEAIAHALAQGKFESRVKTALSSQKDRQAMFADIIWGTQSELAIHGLMLRITERLSAQYGSRVRATPLLGHKHALIWDPSFLTALVLQSQTPRVPIDPTPPGE